MKLFPSLQDCQPSTTIAPSLIDSLVSGIIRSGSNSILNPRPAQHGHAPNGLLNEKLLGSISSMLIPQSGQEKLSEKFKISFSPSVFITSIFIRPSAIRRVVSTESVSLRSISGRTTRRSTTISILCFLFLSSLISSDNSYILPSMIARTKPLFAAFSNSFTCSPFLPLITGASTMNFVRSGNCMISSTI